VKRREFITLIAGRGSRMAAYSAGAGALKKPAISRGEHYDRLHALAADSPRIGHRRARNYWAIVCRKIIREYDQKRAC
jgi:hypothetical protein